MAHYTYSLREKHEAWSVNPLGFLTARRFEGLFDAIQRGFIIAFVWSSRVELQIHILIS